MRQGAKSARFKKVSPRTDISKDPYPSLASLGEDTVTDSIEEKYDRFVNQLSDSAKEAKSLRTTKKRLPLETLAVIRQHGASQASSNYQLTSELAKV